MGIWLAGPKVIALVLHLMMVQWRADWMGILTLLESMKVWLRTARSGS